MPNDSNHTLYNTVLIPNTLTQSDQKPKLGDVLKELRESYNLNQQDMAKIVFLSSGAISKYETHENMPSFDTLIKYSRFFNISIDFLLGETKISDRQPDTKKYEATDPSQRELEKVTVQEDAVYQNEASNLNLNELYKQLLKTNREQNKHFQDFIVQHDTINKQLKQLGKIMNYYSLPDLLTKLSVNNSTQFLSEVFEIPEEQIQTIIEEQQKST